MYYSLIGLLAALILLITNYDVFLRGGKSPTRIQRLYRCFLFSLLAFYVTDMLWGVLALLRLTALLYADTAFFFAVMAVALLFWTRFVGAYLEERTALGRVLGYVGWAFFGAELLMLAANFLWPVMFWFDEGGNYHAGVLRHVTLGVQILMFLLTAAFTLRYTLQVKDRRTARHRAIGFFGVAMAVMQGLQLFFPLLPLYTIGYLLGTCLLRAFVIEGEMEGNRQELQEALEREQLQRQELSQTWKLAYTDALTGVKSKLAYGEKEIELDERIAGGGPIKLAVAVFDVNGLKRINDTLGHETGDQYIRSACRLICGVFRHSPVYRVGGDEFVAVLEGTDFDNREALAADFTRQVEENRHAGQAVVAMGMAELDPGQDNSFKRLFNRADQRMYRHKQELKDAAV